MTFPNFRDESNDATRGVRPLNSCF